MDTESERAEFRVFGRGIISSIQPKLWAAHATLQGTHTRAAETYFLSRLTLDAHVKAHDGQLDIKVKIGQTPDGYEIFRPKGTFQFPITTDQAASIAARLHVQLPESIAFSETISADALLAMATAHNDLRPVQVETIRWGFAIDDITCEYAEVFFNGATLESACVESNNYAGMRDVIEQLGLTDRPNTSYLAAAARVLGIDHETASPCWTIFSTSPSGRIDAKE